MLPVEREVYDFILGRGPHIKALEKKLTSRKHSCAGEPWSSIVKQMLNK
jgi:hypothetical protein